MSEDGIDLPLKEFGQGFKDMGPATRVFEERVLNRQLRHNNPLLDWAIGNVALERDATGAAKPNKRRSHERIDPVVAGIMAVGVAAQEPKAIEPQYMMLIGATA
jgi:phage terminase large subunit-like protein